MSIDAPISRELSAVLDFHAAGFCCVPMRRGTKISRVKWGRFKNERPPLEQLGAWFRRGSYSPGIICGPVSNGLAVRDFDRMDAYEGWRASFPRLADTLPTVVTQRGRHVYMRCEAATLIARLGKTIVACGDGEFKLGGIAMAPPAIHPKGWVYQWERIPELPPPIIDPIAAGLLPERLVRQPCNTEDVEGTEDVENPAYSGGLKTCNPPPSPAVDYLNAMQGAIERTLPGETGNRHRCIFRLARELKAIEELKDAEPQQLRSIFQEWHKRAKPYIATKDWETSWFDFCEGWLKVKFAAGQGPIEQAYRDAIASTPPTCAEGCENPVVFNLILLCRQLQRLTPKEPFFLSVRIAGKLLGVDMATASRYLRGLQFDGIIKPTELGTLKTGKATSFNYLHPLD